MPRYTQFNFSQKAHPGEVINIYKSNMAAAAILDFSKFSISDEIFPISLMPRYMQFKFQPKSSISGVINILVNPRWEAAAILDFENFDFFDQLKYVHSFSTCSCLIWR